MKLYPVTDSEGHPNVGYMFFCPGCKCTHMYQVGEHAPQNLRWTFNGNMEKPTFTPSLLYPDMRCHLFLTDGIIHFCPDCTHALAGKSVPLPDYEP